MRTAVVLFTRDLRVHDNPALAEACASADRVVPLFVFDEQIHRRPISSANKVAFLLDSVADLARGLRARGGALHKRRGRVVDEVGAVTAETGAHVVFVAEDVTAYASARTASLRDGLDVEVRACPGVNVVGPGELTTSEGREYRVFTPYWRAWSMTPRRRLVAPPDQVRTPSRLRVGPGPKLGDVTDRSPAPDLPLGGETEGRHRLDAWLGDAADHYGDARDDLAADATSRLSPYLHLGCLSPLEVVERAPEGEFVRQVCWRDFHHQVLAAHPRAAWSDYRSRGDDWREDPEAFDAWRQGRTGYPIVDAAMRQLLREGWMHNRARLIVASFLTRDLYIDWRAGARHFLEHLVDGDIANNQMNWQWVAGTGTHSRPNRTFNPLRQADKFDPDGDYVRRYVPELSDVRGRAVHRPWDLPADQRAALDYPEPIVDHDAAVADFLAHRSAD